MGLASPCCWRRSAAFAPGVSDWAAVRAGFAAPPDGPPGAPESALPGGGAWLFADSGSVCIVSFTSPRHDQKKVVDHMRKEHKIEIALREGRLRASPHLYNTEAQVERFVDVLPGH